MPRKPTGSNPTAVSLEHINTAILLLRGQRVMLDMDLAALYGVETKVLLQSVRRNRERFTADFMFQLTKQEFADLRSHIVTSNRGGRRYLPYAFTEQGVAMLSSVLKSPQAIQVNIEIMRAFVQLRRWLISNADLARKLDALESNRMLKKAIHGLFQLAAAQMRFAPCSIHQMLMHLMNDPLPPCGAQQAVFNSLLNTTVSSNWYSMPSGS